MCICKDLKILFPLFAGIILAACSRGNNPGGASLKADDLWDHIAAERTKPLSNRGHMAQKDDSGAADSVSPPVAADNLLSQEDRAAYEQILREAAAKYITIHTSLAHGLVILDKAGAEGPDKQDAWRTIQLHLSRLTTLEKNISRAIYALDGQGRNDAENQILIDQSREFLAKISAQIKHIQNRLGAASVPE